MQDPLSERYRELLAGSYDCVDRIVVNGYFSLGHNPGGFREWWRRLFGSDDHLDNTHLMRLAGRFARRVYAFAKHRGIPVVHCRPGEKPHEIAEPYRAAPTARVGLFLITVSRAPAPLWEVHLTRAGKVKHIATKKSKPYVNHYGFHILEAEWGHVTFKICGHPPFPAQIILNGHEYVAGQAQKAGIDFTKEGSCFTHSSDAAGLGRVADTLSEARTIGRLSQVCERWIYTTCLCFALTLEEQQRTGFHYQYSTYQLEYSRNLLFQVGGQMDQVFQALIDRTRALLGVDRVKTIFGRRARPKTRPHKKKAPEWGVVIERPTYDLTVFKVRCGKLDLKIYTKGEHVLRIEVIVHNTRELRCARLLPNLPQIIARLRQMLERFLQTLSCLDACFIGDATLEQLPRPGRVGATAVGGIDFNQVRMRRVAEAVLALSPAPFGFTASDLARKVRTLSGQTESQYSPRRAAYDLKKFRAKQLVCRVQSTRRYEATPSGLRALAALFVLRDKVMKPLLAAACYLKTGRKPNNSTVLDQHYESLQTGMQNLFAELGIAA